MAFNSFFKLNSRTQSGIITQLHKMIGYYGEVFSARERIYLKNLSKSEKAIYWLENENKKLLASALVEPDYIFKLKDMNLITVGHTISTHTGQINRILAHIWNDYGNSSLALIIRPFIANAIDLACLNVKAFDFESLRRFWPELACIKTDYFNVKNEELADGLKRKCTSIYICLCEKDKEIISKTNQDLFNFYNNKNTHS